MVVVAVLGCGICELVARDSVVPWYPQEDSRARLSAEEEPVVGFIEET